MDLSKAGLQRWGKDIKVRRPERNRNLVARSQERSLQGNIMAPQYVHEIKSPFANYQRSIDIAEVKRQQMKA